MTKWRFARPGSTKWALVSMAREVPPRHLLVSSLAIAAYVALALIVFFWGDIRTSCRDASEIAVDGTGQIDCSLPTQASINVYSAQGELVRQLSLETFGGWVSLHEAPDGRVGAYLVRAHRRILFAPDGAVVEAPGDAGSLPRPRHFPITRVEKGESVYSAGQRRGVSHPGRGSGVADHVVDSLDRSRDPLGVDRAGDDGGGSPVCLGGAPPSPPKDFTVRREAVTPLRAFALKIFPPASHSV